MKKEIILGAVLLTAFALKAKTVALWPMEYDGSTGKVDLRCAISGANDFSYVPAGVTAHEQTVGWNLPPNPDETECMLVGPVSRHAFDNQGMIFRVDAPRLSEVLKLRQDFTVEGWIKPREVKDNNWRIIMQTNGGTGKKGGWSWSIRNIVPGTGAKQLNFQTYVAGKQGDTMMGDALTPEEEVDLTNSWHHIALVFKFDNGDGRSQFTFYYDGQEHGVSSAFAPFDDYTPEATFQEFGGRPVESDPRYACNNLFSEWDYWRVSDVALTPDQFLNANGPGQIVPEPIPPTKYTKTFAYWKLGTRSDGSIDAHDYIGGRTLSQGFLMGTSASASETMKLNVGSTISVSTDSACPDDETPGSVFASLRKGGRLRVDGLGSELCVGNGQTKDFTIEGYFRSAECEDRKNVAADCYLFGTTNPGNDTCWALRTRFADPERKLGIMVCDVDPSSGTKTWRLDQMFDASLPKDGSWVHIALTYDHAGGTGNGIWTLYLDGKCCGSIANPVFTGKTASSYFMMFGRGDNNSVFYGGMDNVRVSSAVLQPNQFLCAKNGVAATGVLAFWPFGTSDGVCVDARDSVGAYHLSSEKCIAEDFRLTPIVDDQPVIGSPDPSEKFHGNSARTSGSTAFRSGSKGVKGFLMIDDADLGAKFWNKNEWTLEFYTKRTAEPAAGILGNPIVMLPYGRGVVEDPWCNSSSIVISYRSTGFALHDMSCPNLNNADAQTEFVCTESAGSIPVGEWAHVAIVRVHDEDDATKVIYKFYVNGDLRGSLTGENESVSAAYAPRGVFFGGAYDYYGGNVGWDGAWSSLRFSDSALSKDEFLCASRPQPEPEQSVTTLAYWPFEYSSETLDLYARSKYGYYPRPHGGVFGTADAVRGSVPNPDTNGVVRVKKNVGSVVLDGTGTMTAGGVGASLTYNRPFTVEGSFKWNAKGAAAREIVFGTAPAAADMGWYVYVDHSGETPALKIFARAADNWTAVAGGILVADISSWDGVWKNLVLRYDPTEGEFGQWALTVDREFAGSVDNIWYPGDAPMASLDFYFGAPVGTTVGAGVAGTLDQWRISDRILSEGEVLFTPPVGMLLMVR